MNPPFLPPPIRAARSCSLNTTKSRNTIPIKTEVTHKEIMLPPHVPPEYADRNTLWNSAEAQEKQWNSQLARRFVLAIPREIPSEQHADLIRDYCREFLFPKA